MAFKAGSFAQGFAQGLNPFIEMAIKQKMAEDTYNKALQGDVLKSRIGMIDKGELVPSPETQIGSTYDRLSLRPNMPPTATSAGLTGTPIMQQEKTPIYIGGDNQGNMGYVKPGYYKAAPDLSKQKTLLDMDKTRAEIGKINRTANDNPIINNILPGGQPPTGFEITSYDAKGRPLMKKIDQDKIEQKQRAGDLIKSQAQDTLNTIDEVLKGKDYFGIRSTIPAIPGTPKYIWRTYIDKLTSGKMIDLMTKMKEVSKTGATGFGQLSEREGQILLQAATALKPGISQAEAEKILNTMKVPLQKVLSGQGGEQSGQLMIDKNGNKAMVFPDGTYKEVQ